MSLGSRRALSMLLSACLLGGLTAGCGKSPARREPKKVDTALRANVLDAVPSDIQHRLFIDFGGKVHLLGYNVDPEGVVAPGGTVKVTLYWQSIARLGPGWKLFTHVLDTRGRRIANVDNVGPLRELHGQEQALPPSAWQPGKVYVDEQPIEIPADAKSPEAVVTVGIWREGGTRLEVLSGPSDGTNRAIVVHIKTGLSERPPKPTAPPKKS